MLTASALYSVGCMIIKSRSTQDGTLPSRDCSSFSHIYLKYFSPAVLVIEHLAIKYWRSVLHPVNQMLTELSFQVVARYLGHRYSASALPWKGFALSCETMSLSLSTSLALYLILATLKVTQTIFLSSLPSTMVLGHLELCRLVPAQYWAPAMMPYRLQRYLPVCWFIFWWLVAKPDEGPLSLRFKSVAVILFGST